MPERGMQKRIIGSPLPNVGEELEVRGNSTKSMSSNF
jgi:hypothetical protein